MTSVRSSAVLAAPRLPVARPRLSSPRALLLVVCLAQFMVILDVSVVNVALPAMRNALQFSTAGLQWVVNAYTLTFAGFLMLGGRCADLLGRRRVFLAGTVMFALASLACAVSDTRGLLIASRALQGIGGAVVSPATLSIITSSLPEGRERNRGLAAWGAVGGLGGSLGALLGGILTQALGWPAIFAVNLPLGAIVVALSLRSIARDPGRDGRRHFDVPGALLVTAGLVGVTYGIVRTDTVGWGSPGVLGPLAAGLALLGAFVYVEARVAPAPLVPLAIFTRGRLRAANLIVVLLYFSMFSSFFFLTLYLQQVLHQGPIQAGLSFLPMTLSVFAASSLAARVVARLGLRTAITTGMLLVTAGMVMFTSVRPGASYFALVLPGGIVSGLGMGITLVSSTIAATQGVPREHSGLASGLINMSRLLGGALGLAVLSTIAAAAPAGTGAAGIADGFGQAFTVAAVVTLAGSLVAVTQLRARSTPAAGIVIADGHQAQCRDPAAPNPRCLGGGPAGPSWRSSVGAPRRRRMVDTEGRVHGR